MAAPSPLSQSHPPPQSHDGEASEGEDEEEETTNSTKQVTSALRQLSLVEEVDVDLSNLNALSPEVISKQATINIGE
jgi:translation initiation factor 2 subunit 3